MKRIYVYKVTTDSGNAPCAQDGILSLSCCKGGRIVNGTAQYYGMRNQIGIAFSNRKQTEEIYVMGIYHGEMLYFALVDEVLTMEEYNKKEYQNKRRDQIYDFDDNHNAYRNKNNRLFHPATEEEHLIRDIAGRYAIICNEFVYYGIKSREAPEVSDLNSSFNSYENRSFKLLKGNQAEDIYNKYSCEIGKGEIGKPHDPIKNITSKGCFQK